MIQRQTVRFTTGDHVTLSGYLLLPAGETGPVPGIVMAPGFSAVKEMRLDDYAAAFAGAGLAVLVYDHRNTGDSGGIPRQEIDPWLQVRDYRDAVTYLMQQKGIDSGRIGVWGSSYSGGHVLVIAALDSRVKCLVSQVPIIHGPRSTASMVSEAVLQRLRARFNADRQARFSGLSPAMIPVVSPPDAGRAMCILPGEEAWTWFSRESEKAGGLWKNEVTLRSLEMLYEYIPGAYAELIQAPALIITAREDRLAPYEITAEAFRMLGGRKKLLQVEGGHFAVYGEALQQCITAAAEWFLEALIPGETDT